MKLPHAVVAAGLVSLLTLAPDPAAAAPQTTPTVPEVQGLKSVTESDLGRSVRQTVIGGAQFADTLDLKWERFSDSLRDEQKCDPRTNRRMFDNGVRRDGSPIGNPVLGALCTPEPLVSLDAQVATTVLDAAREAAVQVLGGDRAGLQRREEQIQQLIGPSFERAVVSEKEDAAASDQARQNFNRNVYAQIRAYGEVLGKKDGGSPSRQSLRENSRAFDRSWGRQLLTKLAPTANRNDYTSPFPKPDSTDDQPYNEGALLDALGAVSVALDKLQQGGIVGHWEISIPEDDDWNVVTIAVDDDISMGGQILGRERNQPLSGSAVVAMVRSALDSKANISSYKMDTFFIDPTTTKQELYNPTQLLISLSDLGQ